MIARLRRAARANPSLIAILALSLSLNLIGITWGLPNTESWMADSVAGGLSLKVWATYSIGSHKYPYLQSWLAFLAYSPFLLRWLLTGQLDGGCWPYLNPKCFEADAFAQIGTLILVSRLLSALMGVGTVWLTWRLALAVGVSKRGAHLAALGTASSYAVVFYAHLGTLDGPLAFWYTLSLLAFVGILRDGKVRDYGFFGLAAGAALGTKEGIIGAYVLSAVAILFRQGSRTGPAATSTASSAGESGVASRVIGRFIDLRLPALLLGLLLVYGLAANPVFNWPGFVEHWQQWLPGYSRMQGLQQKFSTVEALQRSAALIAGGMDAPLLLLCLGGLGHGLAQWLRPRRYPPGPPDPGLQTDPRSTTLALALLIPSLSYFAFSVMASRVVHMRVMIPWVPVLAVFGGLLGDRLLSIAAPRRAWVVALLALVYGHASLHALNHDLLFRRDSRYAAEGWLDRESWRQVAGEKRQAASIMAFGDSRYLPRLDWLGLEYEVAVPEAPRRDQLETLGPDLVIVSSRWYLRYEGQPEALFFEQLLAERLGYRIVFDHRAELPMQIGMDTFTRASGSVGPRITILERGEP